jgi:hypothetical protein
MTNAAARQIRSVYATRYVTPLREGGSLPGLIEADDDGLYVVKFRGAGQGPKVLVAELIAGEIARTLGLRVPEIVIVEIDPELGRAEPDQEIQDLLRASIGTNLGLDYLPGSLGYDPTGERRPPPEEAADVVWLDSLVTNVDRTARNPNLLTWHGQTWLIDHGAALYLQHGTTDLADLAERPFRMIGEHVLLPHAASIVDADARLASRLDGDEFARIVAMVPDVWLTSDEETATVEEVRGRYVEYLTRRLRHSAAFADEAESARAA